MTREHLLNRRHNLMHQYGYGPFNDGMVRDAIAAIDVQLAASLEWKQAGANRWEMEMPDGKMTVRRGRNAGRFICWDVTWPDGMTTRRDTREAAMQAAIDRPSRQ